MKIFIVGSGKLANAILNSNISITSCEVEKWDYYKAINYDKSIIVHAGSGRELPDCFNYCSKTKSVLIELSTGSETEKMNPDFPLIVCPNTSVLILKVMSMIRAFGHNFSDYEISITESHQSAKKTLPGTAYSFADSLNFPSEKIISIRDSKVQLNKIGINPEYVDKHAYHRIVIKDGNDEFVLETKVLGHDSYSKGVKIIAEAVLKNEFENKKYSVFDLIESGIL